MFLQSSSEYNLVIAQYLWPISQLEIPAKEPVTVNIDGFNDQYSRKGMWSTQLHAMRAEVLN